MSLLKNFSLVSGTTLLSRVLGLVRDVLFFATFGTSLMGEAFLLAFTIPNLFRRMLGEGTLSSAFIPVFANIQKSDSGDPQWKLLNQVLSRLLLFLGVLSISVCLFSWVSYQGSFFQNSKWHDAIFLNGITFFYVIFICASAILVGALNVKKSFWAGAFSPVILNLFMILTLFSVGIAYNCNFSDSAIILSFSVVLAGIFQLFLPWYELHKRFNWRWIFTFTRSTELSEVGTLFWVGAFGAAIGQINILVSRVLAYLLDDPGPVSYLYMSARLVELPLGVFAIALSTILFPRLSMTIAKGDVNEYKSSFFYGLRVIAMLTLPSAIGLFLVGDLVIKTLFEWKEFSGENVTMASQVLSVVAWTIPLYALSTFLIKSFHSQKNMKVPLRAACISLLVNLAASLSLMNAFGVIGLAWSNLLAAFFQFIYLCMKNKDLSVNSFFCQNEWCAHKILLASLCMYMALYYGRDVIWFGESKLAVLGQLCLMIMGGVIFYFLPLILSKFPLFEGKPLLSKEIRK
ncbi:MAG: murein biosynthesis integral membrane protein MurJ [Opitutae bacterium]